MRKFRASRASTPFRGGDTEEAAVDALAAMRCRLSLPGWRMGESRRSRATAHVDLAQVVADMAGVVFREEAHRLEARLLGGDEGGIVLR